MSVGGHAADLRSNGSSARCAPRAALDVVLRMPYTTIALFGEHGFYLNYFVNMSFAASPVRMTGHSTDMAEVKEPAKTDLSVLIPTLREILANLAVLLPWLNRILDELQVNFEVIVVTKEDDSETITAAAADGAQVLLQVSNGYGGLP